MRGWRRLFDRLTGRADQNLERELRAHLDLEAEELRESGLPHDEARYAALRAFGNTTLAMEDTRAMWEWTWLEHLGQDVRYAIRILRRNPTFALTAVLTLALGIGANSAIFSLINSVLFRPLPFPDDGRLVLFWNDNRTIGFSGLGAVCDPDFLEWQTRNTSFSEIGIFRGQTHNLTSPGDPERLLGAAVTPEVFRLLGAAPVIGPGFHERDGRTEGEPEILLSHRLWSSRFHSDPSVVGKLVVVDTRPLTIAGVMPAWFDFPNGATFWVPLQFSSDCSNAFNLVIARLGPDVGLRAAQTEVGAIAHQLARERRRPADWMMSVKPLREVLYSRYRPTLLLLLGAVGLTLLIACTNVANLLLARGFAREHEIATRRALGAGTRRLVRQFLTESLCLAMTSGFVALCFIYLLRDALSSLLPEASRGPGLSGSIPGNDIDVRVLLFTFGVSLAAGVLFGVIPALRAARVTTSLSARHVSGGRFSPSHFTNSRNLFVTAQTALTLVLLVCAGLLLQSFVRLNRVHPGFEPRNVLTASLELPDTRYPDAVQRIRFNSELLERVRLLPGVRVAGTVGFGLPFEGGGIRGDFSIEGQPPPPEEIKASKLVVSPGYFRTMGIPILRGRDFNERDTAAALPAAIVSDRFASQFWPNESPLGKRLSPGFGDAPPFTIIGVAGDVKQDGLAQAPHLTFYLPYAQAPRPFMQSFMTVVIRTAGDSPSAAAALRAAVKGVDPELPLFDVSSMEQLISRSLSEPRIGTLVVGMFAALALCLATIGIYGVVSYGVIRRTREIGIRMAVGGRQAQIVRMLVGQSLSATLGGVAVGAISALGVTRFLTARLYGIQPNDPATLIGVSLVLTTISAFAAYLAARRIARIDPSASLRAE
jgi:putative ABC transport system permease protein